MSLERRSEEQIRHDIDRNAKDAMQSSYSDKGYQRNHICMLAIQNELLLDIRESLDSIDCALQDLPK